VIQSNSDYHSQLIMKQKDYRFSSLWIWGIPDFLYFSVLAWLTWYCSWWRSWCSCGWTAAGKRWRCL